MKVPAITVAYYREYLSDIGLECDVYSSGKEALEAAKNVEYAFILVSRYLDDISAELFLHHYRENYPLGNALTIMIAADDVSEVMLDANKAGFKLVFNKRDIDSIPAFLTSVLNNRTLNLKGRILYIEDQKSVASAIVALFESYQDKNKTGGNILHFMRMFNHIDKVHIPIFVVSEETDQTKRTAFLRSGANDFIIKPFDEDELIVRASNLIGK